MSNIILYTTNVFEIDEIAASYEYGTPELLQFIVFQNPAAVATNIRTSGTGSPNGDDYESVMIFLNDNLRNYNANSFAQLFDFPIQNIQENEVVMQMTTDQRQQSWIYLKDYYIRLFNNEVSANPVTLKDCHCSRQKEITRQLIMVGIAILLIYFIIKS